MKVVSVPDGCRALGRAITFRAVLDLQQARVSGDEATVSECEEYFRSGYCKFLSGLDGEKLLENLDKITLPVWSNQAMERLIWGFNK